jgi:phosphohistidine phosphatase
MELYLFRHGQAEGIGEALEQGRMEAERRLTQEGARTVARVVERLRADMEGLEWVLHSEYARARETAEILSRHHPATRLVEMPGLTPYDSPLALRDSLHQRRESRKVAVVAHQPLLGATASLLLMGQTTPLLAFRKAGIAKILWPAAGPAFLEYLLAPELLY